MRGLKRKYNYDLADKRILEFLSLAKMFTQGRGAPTTKIVLWLNRMHKTNYSHPFILRRLRDLEKAGLLVCNEHFEELCWHEADEDKWMMGGTSVWVDYITDRVNRLGLSEDEEGKYYDSLMFPDELIPFQISDMAKYTPDEFLKWYTLSYAEWILKPKRKNTRLKRLREFEEDQKNRANRPNLATGVPDFISELIKRVRKHVENKIESGQT